MRARALGELVGRDLRRSASTFFVAALGIAVGIASLAFFLALGQGMKEIVLGKIFPVDRIEVAPREMAVGAVLSFFNRRPPGIEPEVVEQLRHSPGVRAVYPKMRILFPSSGRGGRALLGRDIGTGELVADGIDPALVRDDVRAGVRFEDPLPRASNRVCSSNDDCTNGEYCDVNLDHGGNPLYPGSCAPPIPALVSPYLVEVFNGAIAPAHRLPRIGDLLLRSADGLLLEWDLGRAGLGEARQGTQRRAHVRIVGISPRAIDLGFTVPLDVARRLNREYSGEGTDVRYTSAIVLLAHPEDTAQVTAAVREQGLEVKTTGAEQMGLLVAVITAILSLTSVVVVLVAALNIAHVFQSIIAERRGEIGLMRALGASRGDVRVLVIAQALVLGTVSSVGGVGLARLAAMGWNLFAAKKLPEFPFKPDNWFVFDPKWMGIAVGFGVLACLVSALAPAARAARIEPAAALASGV